MNEFSQIANLFKEIVYLEADINYTKIHLENGKILTVSYTLKKVTKDHLDTTVFVRIHRSFIINKNHLFDIDRSNNAIQLELNNGVKVPVSRRYQKRIGF
jgi:two-component system LytT family response regulator